MRSLVIAQWHDGHFNSATRCCVTAASALGEVDLLVTQGVDDPPPWTTLAGVCEILLLKHEDLRNPVAEDLSAIILDQASDYDALLAPANTFGKNVLPRVAAKLDVSQISDIVKIIDSDTFVRPIYAGNAFVTVQSLDRQKVITTRSTAFEPAQVHATAPKIREITFEPPSVRSTFVSKTQARSDRPSLTSAKIVISGGRGLQSKEKFAIINELADRLGAAVGASRAAVDAGFVPNDQQVGQTGKVVAPDLYIAIGISGAIQHLAGIKDSKVIVAINKDPDAPIFEVANFGLVADFFAVLDDFERALDKLGYNKK